MKLLEQIERINRLHVLIKYKRTGNPDQLADKLQISRSALFRLIDDLKLWEVPIEYSRQLGSYYYPGANHPKVLIDFRFHEFGVQGDNSDREVRNAERDRPGPSRLQLGGPPA